MRKSIFLIICLVAGLQAGWSQNTVESIRQRYADAKEYIDTHKGDNQYDGAEWGQYYYMEASHWLAGTGGHKKKVWMYIGEKEGENEEELIYPPHYLTFATKKYNYAAREFYEEYLYDEDGNVAFIYAYDPMVSFVDGTDDKEYEFRFYINKGRLLKAIIKSRESGQKAFKEEFSGAQLNKMYQDTYQTYVSSAKSILQMFCDIERDAYYY